MEAQAVLQDFQFIGRFAVNVSGDQRQAFEFTHARIVALDHRAWIEFFDQYLDQ